jgi:putative ABC transport system permease protein
METIFQDLKYSFRILRLSPGFALTALAALALGIGANTAIFSVVNAVLLQPLPYPHPDRIVQLLGRADWGTYRFTSVPQFNAYRTLSQIFDDVTAYDWRGGAGINLTDGDRPQQVRGEHVSFEYFRLFGAPFVAGRAFTPQEDRPGGGRVVILSNGLWQRRFGSDGSLVGKSILLGGDPYTVVGIVSHAFAPDPPVDIWIPLPADPNSNDAAEFLNSAARLKPGVTLEQAKAALHLAAQAFHRRFPNMIGRKALLQPSLCART